MTRLSSRTVQEHSSFQFSAGASALVALFVSGCDALESDAVLRPVPSQTASSVQEGLVPPSFEYSHVVELTFVGPNGAFICTGSLVDQSHIVTAAHCTLCADYVTIAFRSTSETIFVQQPIDSVVSHPMRFYDEPPECPVANPASFVDERHDLAVIKLEQPAPFSVAPASILLEPPYGFHPVQKLRDELVLLAGG